MSSTRKDEDIIYGIDTRELKAKGAKVYPLYQNDAITGTGFSEGLCFGITASLMRHLSAGELDIAGRYQNPLPRFVLEEAISLTHEAIERYRDGRDLEKIHFGRRPEKVCTFVSQVPECLGKNTSAATLTYKTKSGTNHTLLFFNRGFNKCIIQDPNRFTIDNLDIESGKRMLVEIIQRSEAKDVIVARINRRSSCKL